MEYHGEGCVPQPLRDEEMWRIEAIEKVIAFLASLQGSEFIRQSIRG